MRLIDAEPLYDIVNKLFFESDGERKVAYSTVLDEIASADVVDAVEILRCKDCKHGTKHEKGKIICNKFFAFIEENDFCNYGEERGD